MSITALFRLMTSRQKPKPSKDALMQRPYCRQSEMKTAVMMKSPKC